jgi:hypothetical protein
MEDVPIRFGWNEQEFSKMKLCKICKSQITDLLKNKEHDRKKFDEMIIEYLRNNLALEELQDGEKNA